MERSRKVRLWVEAYDGPMEVGMKTKVIEITYQCPPQRASITADTQNEEDKMTHSVDISQDPSLTTPILAQWAHGWSRHSDREEAMQGTNITHQC